MARPLPPPPPPPRLAPQRGETPLHKAANKGNVDVIKLLLDGGAKVEAVNNVGPAAAAAPGGARTARTTPPTATTTKTMTTTAFPSPRARNCRNRRVVTLARVPRRNDVMSRENRDFAPRVRGTVRVVSFVPSQRPVSEVAPRLSSRTFSFTFLPTFT